MCMMKNVAMIVAFGLALVCSQACAQKKSDSSSVSKSPSSASAGASASAKESATATQTVAVTKKSKETKTESPAAEPKKATQSKKKTPAATESSTASKLDSSTELTEEQQKKIKAMLRQTLKPFIALELTEEQRQKADDVFGKAVKDYIVKRSRAMITDELQKKHATALKEVKSSGKSDREQTKQAFVTAGFSDEQIKVFKATQTSLTKAKKEFAKTLTEKQLEGLPDQLQELVK